MVTSEPAEVVASKVAKMNEALKELGRQMDNPFMTLSFITLVYIPVYGITDRGPVEFTKFEVVDTVLSNF